MASSSEDESENCYRRILDLKRRLLQKYSPLLNDPELYELGEDDGIEKRFLDYLITLREFLKQEKVSEDPHEKQIKNLRGIENNFLKFKEKIKQAKKKRETRIRLQSYTEPITLDSSSSDEESSSPIPWKLPRRLFEKEYRNSLGLKRNKHLPPPQINHQTLPMEISSTPSLNLQVHPGFEQQNMPGYQVGYHPVVFNQQQPILYNGMMQMLAMGFQGQPQMAVFQPQVLLQQPQQSNQQPVGQAYPQQTGNISLEYGGAISTNEVASPSYNDSSSTSNANQNQNNWQHNSRANERNPRDPRTLNRDPRIEHQNQNQNNEKLNGVTTYGEHKRLKVAKKNAEKSRKSWSDTNKRKLSPHNQTQNNKQRRFEQDSGRNNETSRQNFENSPRDGGNSFRNRDSREENSRNKPENSKNAGENSERNSQLAEEISRSPDENTEERSELPERSFPDNSNSTKEKTRNPQNNPRTSSKPVSKHREKQPGNIEKEKSHENTENNSCLTSEASKTAESLKSGINSTTDSKKSTDTTDTAIENVQENSNTIESQMKILHLPHNSCQSLTESSKSRTNSQESSKTSNAIRNENRKNSQETSTNENAQPAASTFLNISSSLYSQIPGFGALAPRSPPLISPEDIKKEKDLDIDASLTSIAENPEVPIKTEIKEEQGNESETDSNCDSNATTEDELDRIHDNPLDGMEEDDDFFAGVANGAGTSTLGKKVTLEEEEEEDRESERQSIIRCKDMRDLIGIQNSSDYPLPVVTSSFWQTDVSDPQSSPRYEKPASPLENDENWDLPPGESETYNDFDSQQEEDEEEIITPMIPQISQPPPF